MKKLNLVLVTAISAATLAACGGGSSGTTSTGSDTSVAASAKLLGTLAVPNVVAGTSFTYDAGQVVDGKFYLTDRNNKGVDVYNTTYLTLDGIAQGSGSTAFAGQATKLDPTTGKQVADNDKTGPNSLQKIPGTNKLYVTDVNSVKVVDTNTLQVIKVIPISDANGAFTGNRTDGSCLDKVDNIFMAMNSTDNFITWIDANTDKVIARYDYNAAEYQDLGGLEVCAYDPNLKKFFVNNDGYRTALNGPGAPDGALDVFTLGSVQAAAATPSKQVAARVASYPVAGCNPNGLDLGPGNDIILACDPSGTDGAKLITLILDRSTGAEKARVPFGGSDLVSYDPVSNRYFLGSRHWQKAGVADSKLPFNPVLGIIDAAAPYAALTPVAAGSGAHTAVVDSVNGRVYVPFTPTSGSTDFAAGGIAVYSTK